MRRVFFSFHYERDARRAAQVRNSQRFLKDLSIVGRFEDAADWEQVRTTTCSRIKRWIDEQLKGTSVTVVLIGAQTAGRRWVQYEIEQSLEHGKGLLGIHIHALKDMNKGADSPGNIPFRLQGYPIYCWRTGVSEREIGGWVEKAARAAGR